LDSLIAASRAGTNGTVVGVDFSLPMLARASRGAQETRIRNTIFCIADAENLPLRDSSVTVALVHGIFNLNSKREAIFRELARVAKTGGTVYCAELALLARCRQVSSSLKRTGPLESRVHRRREPSSMPVSRFR
jgi:arsenite methyltransferase